MTKQQDESVVADAEVVAETPPTAEESPAISLEDLNNAANLIGIAIKRGAYEPTEVRQVGELYENLTKFLKHQVGLYEKQQAAESEEVKGA